jgi:signal peptidase II
MLIAILSLLVLGIDQLTKYLIMKNFYLGESIPVIPKILNFTYIHNTGTAFGIMRNSNLFFIVFTILFFVFVFIYRKKINKYYKSLDNKICFSIGCAFLFGGALGNFFDRVFRGRVIDFIDFKIWPVFNIADSCITVSAFILLFYVWKYERRNPNKVVIPNQ